MSYFADYLAVILPFHPHHIWGARIRIAVSLHGDMPELRLSNPRVRGAGHDGVFSTWRTKSQDIALAMDDRLAYRYKSANNVHFTKFSPLLGQCLLPYWECDLNFYLTESYVRFASYVTHTREEAQTTRCNWRSQSTQSEVMMKLLSESSLCSLPDIRWDFKTTSDC